MGRSASVAVAPEPGVAVAGGGVAGIVGVPWGMASATRFKVSRTCWPFPGCDAAAGAAAAVEGGAVGTLGGVAGAGMAGAVASAVPAGGPGGVAGCRV